jgi:leucyl-tRNA synthetase
MSAKEWSELPDGAIRETDTMPGYAGSSWYFLRYMDPKNENEFVSKKAVDYWQNVDFYIGGAEHAVGHLMYARMWHKFFYDMGWVNTPEPFQKLMNQGMIQGRSSIVYRINGTNTFVSASLKNQHEITEIRVDVNLVENDILNINAFKNWRKDYTNAEFILENGKYLCGYEVEKMSKRWHNVVNTDDIIENYGADTLRMYEMFLGPIEMAKPWDMNGIDGVSRFLNKFWRLFFDPDGNQIITDDEPTKAELKTLHKTLKKVSEDIEKVSLNTAVSAFMICVNELTQAKCNKRAILEKLVIAISPFAPHITEELWNQLGHKTSIVIAEFPKYDEQYLKENTFTYPVSVNGKVRAKLELDLALSKEDVAKEVLMLEAVRKWTNGGEPKKVIVVPGRIVNVVVD